MMSDDLLRAARRAIRRTVNTEGTPGVLGKADGTIRYTDDAGNRYYDRMWARVNDKDATVEVLCRAHGMPPIYDLPVIIAEREGENTIIGVDYERASSRTDHHISDVSEHAWTHGRFGADSLYISGLQFLPLVVRPSDPSDMTVTVEPGFYRYNETEKVLSETTSDDLSGYVPSSATGGLNNQHFVVLCLDRENDALEIVDGTTTSTPDNSVPFDEDDVIALTLPDAYMPLAAIRLYDGQTEIVANDIFMDVRQWGGEYHPMVSLDADAATILSMSVQELGLKEQSANEVFAGPSSGGDDTPSFRALALDELPAIDLDDLNDVDAAAPDDEDALAWNEANAAWEPSPAAGGTNNLVFSQVVDVEVVNTTDESTLLGAGRGSKTIEADELDVGTTIRLTLAGHLSGGGAPNLTIDVDLGGTQIATTGAQALNDTVTEADWRLTFAITCRDTGATGHVVGSGLFEHDDDAQFGLVNASEVEVDTTGALALDVTVTWGTADADNTITCQEATIELLQADTLAVAAPSGLTATEAA